MYRICIHRNLRQEKNSPFLPPALIGKKFITLIFLSFVNDCIEDVAIMTALAKILSMHQNTKVAGLGKIENFHVHSILYEEYISNVFLIILRKSYA